MKNELAKLFSENTSLLIGADWLLKSFIILLFASILNFVLRKTATGSSTRHLVWMYSIVCLGMLPIVTFGLGNVATVPLLSGNVITLNTFPEHVVGSIEANEEQVSIALLFLSIYSFITGLLLLRILGGIAAVFRSCRQAIPVMDAKTQELARILSVDLGLSRTVVVKTSKDFASPFSCGVLFPKVILPEDATNWPNETLKSVLLHELMHIRRLDWLTMLICHLVICMYWLNPLCWFALRRLNDEAESSCDSAVLAQGLDATFYAKSLVYIARRSRNKSMMLVQMMAGREQLSQRINDMFDGTAYRASMASKFHLPLVVFCFLLIASFSNLNIVSAKSINGNTTFNNIDYLKSIHLAVPIYPAIASQAKISGSHLMYFTVLKNGSVDPRSIGQLSLAPGTEFYQAAREAVLNFKFEPPILNGVTTEIPNVRLRINYSGADENVSASLLAPQLMNRDYLPANHFTPDYPLNALESNAEGHVLVEFTITEAGKASDAVIVSRGSSSVFDASAIAAVEKLQFKPRLLDGVPTDAHGVQYMFRYKFGRGTTESYR